MFRPPVVGCSVSDQVYCLCSLGVLKVRTWTRVWEYNGDSLLARTVLKEALLGAIVASAGETCEVEEDWDLAGVCLRW